MKICVQGLARVAIRTASFAGSLAFLMAAFPPVVRAEEASSKDKSATKTEKEGVDKNQFRISFDKIRNMSAKESEKFVDCGGCEFCEDSEYWVDEDGNWLGRPEDRKATDAEQSEDDTLYYYDGHDNEDKQPAKRRRAYSRAYGQALAPHIKMAGRSRSSRNKFKITMRTVRHKRSGSPGRGRSRYLT